jgi:hypothetical protein
MKILGNIFFLAITSMLGFGATVVAAQSWTCTGGTVIARENNPFLVCDNSKTQKSGIYFDNSSQAHDSTLNGDEFDVDCGGSTLKRCDLSNLTLSVNITSYDTLPIGGGLYVDVKEGTINNRYFMTKRLTSGVSGDQADTGRIILGPTRAAGSPLGATVAQTFSGPPDPDPNYEVLTAEIFDIAGKHPTNFSLEGIALLTKYLRQTENLTYVVAEGGSFGAGAAFLYARMFPSGVADVAIDGASGGGAPIDLIDFYSHARLKGVYGVASREDGDRYAASDPDADYLQRAFAFFNVNPATVSKGFTTGYSIPIMDLHGQIDLHYSSPRLEEYSSILASLTPPIDWITVGIPPEAGHGDTTVDDLDPNATTRRQDYFNDVWSGPSNLSALSGLSSYATQFSTGTYDDFNFTARPFTSANSCASPASSGALKCAWHIGNRVGTDIASYKHTLKHRFTGQSQDELVVANLEGWINRYKVNSSNQIVRAWSSPTAGYLDGSRIHSMAIGDVLSGSSGEEIVAGTTAGLYIVESTNGAMVANSTGTPSGALGNPYRDVQSVLIEELISGSSGSEIAFVSDQSRLVIVSPSNLTTPLVDSQIGNFQHLFAHTYQSTKRICGVSGSARVVCFELLTDPATSKLEAVATMVSEELEHIPAFAQVLPGFTSSGHDVVVTAGGYPAFHSGKIKITDLTDGSIVNSYALNSTLADVSVVHGIYVGSQFGGTNKFVLYTGPYPYGSSTCGVVAFDAASGTFSGVPFSRTSLVIPGEFRAGHTDEAMFIGSGLNLDTISSPTSGGTPCTNGASTAVSGAGLSSSPGRYAMTAYAPAGSSDRRLAWVTGAGSSANLRFYNALDGSSLSSMTTSYPLLSGNFPKKLERIVHTNGSTSYEKFMAYEHPGGSVRIWPMPDGSGGTLDYAVGGELRCGDLVAYAPLIGDLNQSHKEYTLHNLLLGGTAAQATCEVHEFNATALPTPSPAPGTYLQYDGGRFYSQLDQIGKFEKADVEVTSSLTAYAKNRVLDFASEFPETFVVTPGGNLYGIWNTSGAPDHYQSFGSGAPIFGVGNTFDVGNINGSTASPEIYTDVAVATLFKSFSHNKTITVIDSNMQQVVTSDDPKYPVGIYLTDMNGDGRDEVIVGTLAGEIKVYAYDSSLTVLTPVFTYSSGFLSAGLHDSISYVSHPTQSSQGIIVFAHSAGATGIIIDTSQITWP